MEKRTFCPIESTIIKSLRISAERFPNRTAIICDEDSITFSQLFENVMELAGELFLGNQARVYIINERKIETIIKMLATLAAGKRYRVVNDFSEIDEEENAILDRQMKENDFAKYNVMYEIKTSGTTGKKKLIQRYQLFFMSLWIAIAKHLK